MKKNLYQYRLSLKNGTYRDGLILQIGEGFGDIAPLPGFSRETFSEAKEEAMRLLAQFPQATPQLPSVQFALDCAQKPLPSSVKLSINALNEMRDGCKAIKLKLGHLSVQEAIDLLKKTPKHVEIRLDFNRKWPLDKLLSFAAHFSPDNFAYLEEPTPRFSDLLSFSRLTEFPLAVDESIPEVPYWEIPTLKAVIVKPTILGKIPFAPPHTELIFSSAYESGIGVLHLARLAAQYNPDRPHGFAPYLQLTSDLISPAPTLLNGVFSWEAQNSLQLEHPSLCLIASAP